VTLHDNRGLQGTLVWKLRRERERSVPTAYSTAGQTMNETEKISAK